MPENGDVMICITCAWDAVYNATRIQLVHDHPKYTVPIMWDLVVHMGPFPEVSSVCTYHGQHMTSGLPLWHSWYLDQRITPPTQREWRGMLVFVHLPSPAQPQQAPNLGEVWVSRGDHHDDGNDSNGRHQKFQ